MKTIMHNSVSLDGSFINFDVDMGLHYQLANRLKADAHLIGSDTVTAGIELYGGKTPLEKESDFVKPERATGLPYWVIVDSWGKTKGLLHTCRSFEFCKDVIVLISRKTDVGFIDYLKRRSYDYLVCGNMQVDFEKAYEALTEKYGIRTILVDSGPTLNGVLLDRGLIDEISLLVFPVLVGKKSNKLLAQLIIGNRNVDLKQLEQEHLDKGLVSLRYQVLK
jgi:2,5-diamino-6-(ribosylamino)-4(3H)-pyrimidinone 5'-phosphate reductase